MKPLSGFIIAVNLCLHAQSQTPLIKIKNDLEISKQNFPWTNESSIVEGNAFSGTHFSRTDSIHTYSFGYKGEFPEACKRKNLRIKCSEYLRTDRADSKFQLVINILYKDSLIIWEGRQVLSRLKKRNFWTRLEDEISVPQSMTGDGFVFAYFLWNEDRKAVVDLDDLELSFEEIILPSFVPAGLNEADSIPEFEFRTVYSGLFFRVDYDKSSGHLKIKNHSGQELLQNFIFYSAWKESDGNEIFESKSYKFYLKSDSSSEEGRFLRFEMRSPVASSELNLRFDSEVPVMEFRIRTLFLSDLLLVRQALAIHFSAPLLEVFRASSLSDTSAFQEEYWLGQGGMLCGDSNTSILIHHPDQVSSMQLVPKDSLILVNMDLSSDHPLLHWPLMKKSNNYKTDVSPSMFKAGDVLLNRFSVFTNTHHRTYPRFLKQPYGNSATMIWTEHADFTDLRTQRAVYFGSENIHAASEAVGGFIGHHIPVTKSVYYSNPEQEMNTEKGYVVKSEVANIKSTSGFSDFLKDLQSHGIEICLHTPDPFTTKRALMEQAMKDMQADFKPVSWIDHGYDNAPSSNREDLVCDALDSSSIYYCADLWKKYGIRYVWNCFYEDSPAFSNYYYSSFLTSPYSGWGDAFPVPAYWFHPTRSAELVHWRTTETMDPADGNLWSYYFNSERLDDLVHSRGVHIIHSYPARMDSTNGYYQLRKGEFIINPEFDRMLENLSVYRDRGLIWLSTIRDWMDYQLSLRKISIHVLNNGKVELVNTGSEMIRGLSMAIHANEIHVRDKILKTRRDGNDLLFWFDLAAGERVEIDWK